MPRGKSKKKRNIPLIKEIRLTTDSTDQIIYLVTQLQKHPTCVAEAGSNATACALGKLVLDMLFWELNRIIDNIGSCISDLNEEYNYDLSTLGEHVDFGIGSKHFLAMVISERTRSLKRRGLNNVGYRNLFLEILPMLPEGKRLLQALMEFYESFVNCIKKQSKGYTELFIEARSGPKRDKARREAGLDQQFQQKIRDLMELVQSSEVKKTLMKLRKKVRKSMKLVMSDWNSDLEQICSIKICKPLVIRESRSARLA